MIRYALQVCLFIIFVNSDVIVQPMSGAGVEGHFIKRNERLIDASFNWQASNSNLHQLNPTSHPRNWASKRWDIRNLDLSHFRLDQDDSTKWIGYFHEEIIIPVLQTTKRLMIDCVVIEVRQERQQREALFDLGKYMQLVPLEFDAMVTLTGLCGQLKSPTFGRSHQLEINNKPANEPSPNFGSVVLPGTLWCGLRDVARNYEDLGEMFQLDSCCRDHDHCPVKLSSFESRYGILNFGLATRSHCMCDRIFYDCLKNSSEKAAQSIGNVYFNFLKITCLEDRTEQNIPTVHMLYKCTQMDENNGCRMWVKRKNLQKKLKLTNFPMKF